MHVEWCKKATVKELFEWLSVSLAQFKTCKFQVFRRMWLKDANEIKNELIKRGYSFELIKESI